MIVKIRFIPVVFLGLISCSFADSEISDDVSTPSAEQRIFFLHEDNLMSTSCAAEAECSKPELISDKVKDYVLDEAQMRLYWLANNGSFYLKQFPDGIPIKQLLLPSGKNGKISYNLLTNKLNLDESISNVSKSICATGFHAKIIDSWIDPFTTDYKGKFNLDPGDKFIRMVRNYQTGLVYVMIRNGQSNNNIYRFNADGSNKTLIVKNLTSDEFDVDYKNKTVFGFRKGIGIVGVYPEERNFTFSNQINDQNSSLSLDDNQRIWTTFSDGSKKFQIGWCKPNGQCKQFETLKLDYKPRKLHVWRSIIDESETATHCTSRADCQDSCLLSPCWPFPKCECDGRCTPSARELRRPRKRQAPYDMYNYQQSTLRPQSPPPNPGFLFMPYIFG